MENGGDEEQTAVNIIEQLADGNIEQITIVSSEGHHELTTDKVENGGDSNIIEQLADGNIEQITIVSSDGHHETLGQGEVNIEVSMPDLAGSSQDIPETETPMPPPKRPRKSDTPTTGPRKKYRKRWESFPEYEDWLSEGARDGYARCTLCECDIDIREGKAQLAKHARSLKHSEKMGELRAGNNGTPSEGGVEKDGGELRIKTEPTTYGMTPKRRAVELRRAMEAKRASDTRQAEAQIVAFIVENNLPISLVDRLVAMIKSLPSVGPAIKAMHLGKQKATNMVRQGFAPFFRDILVDNLKDSLFSIMVDEVPDNSKNANLLAIFICFANKDLEIEVDLLEFVETDGTSKQAIETLKDCLSKIKASGVELQNWIGFHGGPSLTKHEAPTISEMIRMDYPWVVIAASPVQVAQQAASSACEAFPKNLEDTLRFIHQHFSSLPRHAQSVIAFQELATLDMDAMLPYGQTKWLSVYNLVKAVLEKWADLQVHFTNAIMEDPNGGNDSVMEILLNPIMKVMLLFLENVLSIVCDYCESFRSDEPVYCNLKGETCELISTIAKSFMTKESVLSEADPMRLNVTDDGNLLPLSQLYLGFEAASALTAHMEQCQLGFDDGDVVLVLSTAQNFYRSFILQIQSGLDFSTPIFRFVNIISPVKAYNRDPPSLMEFFTNFAHPAWPKRAMEEEWRSICLLDLPNEETMQSPLAFWKLVLDSKTPMGVQRFQHLQHLVQFFMSLPYSRDASDTVLKLMKEVRANSRKYLKTVTLSACLRSHCGLRRVPNAINDPHLKKRLQSVKSNAKSGDCDDIPILEAN